VVLEIVVSFIENKHFKKGLQMKPTLFFDFDDTSIVTRDAIRLYFKQRYGVDLPEGSYLHGKCIWKLINDFLPPDQMISRDAFYLDWRDGFLTSQEWHKNVRPVEGADNVIRRLARRYQLWIVIVRQQASSKLVSQLCQKFFGQCISGFHFVWSGDGHNSSWKEESKKDFIAGFPGDKVAFFDDSPDEIRNVQEVLPAYLFDPVGYHAEASDIRCRVKSWDEIATLLL